jgi:hypothetical protein
LAPCVLPLLGGILIDFVSDVWVNYATIIIDRCNPFYLVRLTAIEDECRDIDEWLIDSPGI